ncbi:MAG: amidohydrolase [Chloroflexi bacterium]|nr:amidohydrolase [Chloroflexota bacterium]
MADYPVIDVHVHTHRDARTGVQAMGGSPRTPQGWSGTIEELLPFMAENGIEKIIQVNFTPVWDMLQAARRRLPQDQTPAQRAEAEEQLRQEMVGRVIRRNEWTCQVAQEHSDKIVAYVGIDPVEDAATMASDLEACHQRGARGIKLHTCVQRVAPNDRRLWPGYEALQRLGMAVLSHCGPFEGIEFDASRPKLFEEAARDFPNLTLVLAHCGGQPYYDEAVELAQRCPNVYFDCTGVVDGSGRRATSDQEIVALFRRIGLERIMFGSDWAFRDPMPDVHRVERLPLSTEEKRMVLAENARRVLGL